MLASRSYFWESSLGRLAPTLVLLVPFRVQDHAIFFYYCGTNSYLPSRLKIRIVGISIIGQRWWSLFNIIEIRQLLFHFRFHFGHLGWQLLVAQLAEIKGKASKTAHPEYFGEFVFGKFGEGIVVQCLT